VRYIRVMSKQTHRFKCIVTALVLVVGVSLPAFAQQATLDTLYQELLEADEASYPRIESRIVAQWEKSGSPAMDLLLRRGQDALDEGAADIAVEHFSALVDHAPEFTQAYYGRATAYYALGLVGPALDDISTALRQNPRHFEAIRALALLMEELQRPDDALSLYRMILAINPQSAETQDAVNNLLSQRAGQAL